MNDNSTPARYEDLVEIGDKLVSKAFETSNKKKTVPLSDVIDKLQNSFAGIEIEHFREPVICEKNSDTENYIVSEKLLENPFVYKCGEECRRSLSNFAANLGGSIDFLMWIVICSIPLTPKTPPEFQSLLNLYLRVIYHFCATSNFTQLFKLDYSMVRAIVSSLTLPELIGSKVNFLELGPNPIVWIARKASIRGLKANTKKPNVEPETEAIWNTLETPETFSKYLSKADIKYRMVEQSQRENEPERFFDENIANSLFQAFFCPARTVELENAELLENSLIETLKLESHEKTCRAIGQFLWFVGDTHRWVQYIRAYIQKDETSQRFWCREIIDMCENELTEKFCLFDSIHAIFKPTTLECTLRVD